MLSIQYIQKHFQMNITKKYHKTKCKNLWKFIKFHKNFYGTAFILSKNYKNGPKMSIIWDQQAFDKIAQNTVHFCTSALRSVHFHLFWPSTLDLSRTYDDAS